MNSSISFLSVLHNEKISSMYLFHSRGLVFLRFSFYHQHKDVGKGDYHLCAHCGSVCLEIVFAVEFKWVLLKNKFKDSSEGLGGDRGVFPVESLVCFAYCVYSLFLWDICVQASARLSGWLKNDSIALFVLSCDVLFPSTFGFVYIVFLCVCVPAVLFWSIRWPCPLVWHSDCTLTKSLGTNCPLQFWNWSNLTNLEALQLDDRSTAEWVSPSQETLTLTLSLVTCKWTWHSFSVFVLLMTTVMLV